jgi:hypothetical protein
MTTESKAVTVRHALAPTLKSEALAYAELLLSGGAGLQGK